MGEQNRPTIKLTAWWLVWVHFVTVVLHSVAHEVLSVKATTAQLAFIVPFIIVGPVVAGIVLRKFERAGAVLLLASMVGSFCFGLYYHFVADTIDHVAHVARLRPEFWSLMFRGTAYVLLLTEAAGALVAWPLVAHRAQVLKAHAARTGL